MTDVKVTPEAAIDQFWDIAERFHTGMLVSRSARGLHARPMATIWRRETGLLWFLTSIDTEKREELVADPAIAVTLSEGSRHAAIAGDAAIVDDRTVVRGLWNPGAQAYYPNGPDDPTVLAIKVVPEIAEYWDGPTAPVQLFRMGLALVTGQTADTNANTAKIDMQSGNLMAQD